MVAMSSQLPGMITTCCLFCLNGLRSPGVSSNPVMSPQRTIKSADSFFALSESFFVREVSP